MNPLEWNGSGRKRRLLLKEEERRSAWYSNKSEQSLRRKLENQISWDIFGRANFFSTSLRWQSGQSGSEHFLFSWMHVQMSNGGELAIAPKEVLTRSNWRTCHYKCFKFQLIHNKEIASEQLKSLLIISPINVSMTSLQPQTINKALVLNGERK